MRWQVGDKLNHCMEQSYQHPRTLEFSCCYLCKVNAKLMQTSGSIKLVPRWETLNSDVKQKKRVGF